MPIFELNRRPSHRQLRQFGVICLVALPLAGWLWGAGVQTIGLLAAVGFVLAALGMIVPQALRPAFIGLSLLTMPIGLVLGELALLLIYFGLLLPLGLAFRWIGRDALELRWDRSAGTYWRVKKQPDSAARYFRQS